MAAASGVGKEERTSERGTGVGVEEEDLFSVCVGVGVVWKRRCGRREVETAENAELGGDSVEG